MSTVVPSMRASEGRKARFPTLVGSLLALLFSGLVSANDAVPSRSPYLSIAQLTPAQRSAILGEPVQPGRTRQRYWSAGQSLAGLAVPTPVLISRGNKPGPTLCLTGAVHGDELNGVEIIRRVVFDLQPEKLAGTVIGVPIVNLHGFHRSSRYLPDRRDLNRYFPGNPNGSAASRIAYSFFVEVIRHCDYLIDIHTGSFHRTNLPQLRADMNNPDVVALSRLFADIAVLNSAGGEGTLRRAASDFGIPTVTLEAGEPLRLQPKEVEQGVKGIRAVLRGLKMLPGGSSKPQQQPIFYQSTWLRADQGGILLSSVRLGQNIEPGQTLGTVIDPINNRRNLIVSNVRGQVLGMALNQMVMPGFAAFHIGIEGQPQSPAETSGIGQQTTVPGTAAGGAGSAAVAPSAAPRQRTPNSAPPSEPTVETSADDADPSPTPTPEQVDPELGGGDVVD